MARLGIRRLGKILEGLVAVIVALLTIRVGQSICAGLELSIPDRLSHSFVAGVRSRAAAHVDPTLRMIGGILPQHPSLWWDSVKAINIHAAEDVIGGAIFHQQHDEMICRA